ncbi:MAG: PepSY-like domain-containing protein [Chitinophagaceae bacterium]|nr:PepSY-like domain-containing protein [Chitinophagaceae bacterium]
MKKVLFLILVIVAGSTYTSNAQIRKIPAEVTNAFSEKYADAKNVEWKDKLSNFVAAFELDGNKYEARFNKKGEWLNTENELDIDDLTDNVKEGLGKSKYADWEIKSLHRIELPEDKIQYRVHVAKTSVQQKNLLFNESGKLLKDNLTL